MPPHRFRSLLSLALGVALSALLAATLTMASLKAGIMPGVSPLLLLIAWGAFARWLRDPGAARWLNWTQVAGSAGVAVATGVVFTAPLLPVLVGNRAGPGLPELIALEEALNRASPGDASAALELAQTRAALLAAAPGLDLLTLFWMSLAGALLGFGCVGLATRRFLSDPTLPAPEANACRTLVSAALTAPEARPKLVRSLGLGLILGASALLFKALGFAREAVQLLPLTPNARGVRAFSNSDGSRSAAVELQLAPIFLGIGALLQWGTALLVSSGSLLHAAGAAACAKLETGSHWAALWPANSMRWAGGAAMTVAVLWSLLKFAREPKTSQPSSPDAALDLHLLTVPARSRGWLVVCLCGGAALLLAFILVREGLTPLGMASFSVVLALTAVMVTLGALLSLQIGSSASPLSGTVLVSTLCLCGVAFALERRALSDVELLAPLLVALCVAVCAANDSSQDYKTLFLCGIPPRDGFLAQGLGLLAGVLVVPLTVHVAHKAYVFGSHSLPAPQGTLFATIVDAVLLRSSLPLPPIALGLFLGTVAVLVEQRAARAGRLLPSMAFAVGLYLPPPIGFGMFLGGLARRIGQRGAAATSEVILCAAGLITGSALLDLIFGLCILSAPGFDPLHSLRIAHWGSAARAAVTLLVLCACFAVLARNARRPPT